jgi:acetyl-CoA acetyltransferase
MNVASGLADLTLVVGVEKMTEVSTSMATGIMGRGGDAIWEYPFGTTFPGYYAMIANAHMANSNDGRAAHGGCEESSWQSNLMPTEEDQFKKVLTSLLPTC